jgi:hypothetical protein
MMREHFVCPDCGPHVSADEDGCCATCGRDAKIEACLCREQMQAKLAAALRERDEAVCRRDNALRRAEEMRVVADHALEARDKAWATAVTLWDQRAGPVYVAAMRKAREWAIRTERDALRVRVAELETEDATVKMLVAEIVAEKTATERRRVYARCAEIADHYAKSKRLVMLRHDGPATALAIKTAIEADAEKDT